MKGRVLLNNLEDIVENIIIDCIQKDFDDSEINISFKKNKGKKIEIVAESNHAPNVLLAYLILGKYINQALSPKKEHLNILNKVAQSIENNCNLHMHD